MGQLYGISDIAQDLACSAMTIRKLGLSVKQLDPGTRLSKGLTCIVLLLVVTMTTGVTAMSASSTTHHNQHSGGDYSSCQTLDIERRYANADGIYALTSDNCEHSSEPYFGRIDNSSPMYFYPLEDGRWGVFNVACNANTYGLTRNVTSTPWTTVFAATHPTIITCVDLEQRLTVEAGVEEGELDIPYFRRAAHLSHRYDATLPDTVASVNFTVQGSCGSAELRGISINIDEGHNVISLVSSCDVCQISSESCGEASFEFQPDSVYRGFQLTVNVSDPVSEGFSIQYTLNHMETTAGSETTLKQTTRPVDVTTLDDGYSASDPAVIVSRPRDVETTMPGDYGDYFTGSGDDYEKFPYVPENDVTENSKSTMVTQSTATAHDVTPQRSEKAVYTTESAKDPCAGQCVFHKICVSGLCVCPLPSSCPQKGGQPMCVNGIDYPSECHVNIEVCRLQAVVAVSVGTCQDREDRTLPDLAAVELQDPTGATLLEDDLLILIIVISLLVLLIIIMIIICVVMRRRSKRGKLTLTATQPQQQKTLIDEKPKPRVLVEKKRAPRTSSSTSENYRASPKPRHQMLPADKKPEPPIDPDRFSLSGCITPLHEMTDPFETFKPEEQKTGVNKTGSEPERPLSALDPNVVDKKMDGDSGIAEEGVNVGNGVCVGADQPAPAVKREGPPKRTPSTAGSAVYEIQPHEGATIELDVFEDPFEDDTNVITTV